MNASRHVSQHASNATHSAREAIHGMAPILSSEIFTPNVVDPRNVRIRVAADNRLLRPGLLRFLSRRPELELSGIEMNDFLSESFPASDVVDLLLLASSDSLAQDISLIRHIRTSSPAVRIVMFAATGESKSEFFQYVRAGVRGYLLHDASPAAILEAILAVHAGSAACPISLCGVLFAYFEREGTSLPSGAVHQQLGLTRREQQLVPLIARGLTNKEIANHFCLSEQTVKNHLYRMKHKVGADNRLGIVQTCHMQGFLL